MWEKLGQELEVALYVRAVKDAEKSDASTASRTLVVRMMEGLGLSSAGLRANRWQIVEDGAEVRSEGRPRVSSSKSRLRVVSDVESA